MSTFEQITNEKLDNAKVGDGVSWTEWSGQKPGTISKRTAKIIWVVQDKAKLLNGVHSGEPDALQFEPGGFVGHTSGIQRYDFSPGEGSPVKFTRRKNGSWREVGTGLKSRGGRLSAGRAKHYDYNF